MRQIAYAFRHVTDRIAPPHFWSFEAVSFDSRFRDDFLVVAAVVELQGEFVQFACVRLHSVDMCGCATELQHRSHVNQKKPRMPGNVPRVWFFTHLDSCADSVRTSV